MNLPLPFLLGVAVLLLHDQLFEVFPRSVEPGEVIPFLSLVFLPAWLYWLGGVALIRARRRGRRSPLLRVGIRLLPLSVPAAFAAMVVFGELPRCVLAITGDSASGFLVLALAPLWLMEVACRVVERRLDALPPARLLDLPMAPPGHGAMLVLVSAPLVFMAAGSDLARLVPWFDAFLAATALGHMVGFALAIVVLGVLLPLLFRCCMPVTTQLPARVAADVHATAKVLGFAPSAVLYMHTGHRMPNAAMVGPLPWPRYLMLTDALVALLDTFALRGVVAHEVGHARAGHAGILMGVFVGLPLLLAHPIWIWFGAAGPYETAAAGAGTLVVGALLMRRLAHRFEHEADQLSSEALGGAGPCIDALSRVGQLGPHSSQRGSFRHPSDRARIKSLLRWEADPAARARFVRRGRVLRVALGVATLGAAVACAVAQVVIWPLDRATYAFHVGDFATAETRLQALADDLPPALADEAKGLRGLVAAARSIVPEGGAWHAIADRIADGAVAPALERVRANDAIGARPWLALALARARPEPWRETLYLMVGAAEGGDAARLDRLRTHLATVAAPPEVVDAARELRASAPSQ